MTTRIERSIEVDVPVEEAYDQWIRFEDLPVYLPGVERVERIDDCHVRWRARVGGAAREGILEILEQVPLEHIAWRSTAGPVNAGVVTFHRLEVGRSKVIVHVDYEPVGLLERAADFVGFTSFRLDVELRRFKRYLESRGEEAGARRESTGSSGSSEPSERS